MLSSTVPKKSSMPSYISSLIARYAGHPTELSVHAYARSLADYVIAQMHYPAGSPELRKAANNVLIAIPGGYHSVERLADALGNNSWGGNIYEAWALETCDAIRSCRPYIHPLEDSALREAANHLYDFTVTPRDARKAIQEARNELYGEGESDGEYDDDDDD